MTFWTQSSPHIGEHTRRWVSDGYEFLRGLDKDTSNGFLARLYLFSGDKERMMVYANKLPENMKQDFLYLLSPYD